MNRPYRPKPTAANSQPVPLAPLFNRILVGAFAALVTARPLVSGDDPGRLRLTSGSGPVSFTLSMIVVLLGYTVWQVAKGRGRPADWAIVPMLLAGVGVVAYISSRLGDRYARPGMFVAWEWIGLAIAFYLARRLTASANDSRGILNLMLASAVSIGAISLYQVAAGPLDIANTDVEVPAEKAPLAGDDEFYPELNRSLAPMKQPHGTFDSPETLLAYLLLILPAAVVYARFRTTTAWRRAAVLIPLVLIAGALGTLVANPFGGVTAQWSEAIELATRHPAFGVGPGNFSRHVFGVLGPHSAWFGMAATMGIIGLALFAGAAILAMARARPGKTSESRAPAPAERRWEFHFGGMAGLVLGFIWSVGELPAEAPANEVLRVGFVAVLRAIVWFLSFALLETIRPTRLALGRAIFGGAGLALVYGLVFDAPGFMTILIPLFVMLALGANLRLPDVPELPEGGWTKPVRVVSMFLVIGLGIAHLNMAAVPAWSTADGVRQARMASRVYPDLHREIERARPGAERATALTKARGFLLGNILQPLREASERDPGNAALLLELSRWRRPLWEYQLAADPENAARVADDTLRAADRAGKLDPNNPAAQRSLIEALTLFRKNSSTRAAERVVQINKRIAFIVEREPKMEVPLRFRVVQMLLDLKESDELLKPEITRLFDLDREEGHGHLTKEQKTEIVKKAKDVMKDVPKAVLEEWTN
ncbi:MAG TPA: hypothetical protein VHR66_08240 [Gemmataceae bacterium]|jgi:hypothetical protein|nr:hypothetical protein [Gemmataceae bacterium]